MEKYARRDVTFNITEWTSSALNLEPLEPRKASHRPCQGLTYITISAVRWHSYQKVDLGSVRHHDLFSPKLWRSNTSLWPIEWSEKLAATRASPAQTPPRVCSSIFPAALSFRDLRASEIE